MPALLLLLIINMPLFANDSRTAFGSSVEVIDNEQTNIIMQEEVINITLHKEYYEVDVTFDFYNSGEEEKVLLGFPVKAVVYNTPEEKKYADVKGFKSYINGKIVSDYVIKKDTKNDRSGYLTITKWYLREVIFPGNEHTYSRVTYNMPYSYGGSDPWAGYIYGTGKNWKGAIGKMIVNISHGDDIIIDRNNPFRRNEQFNFTWEADGKYKYVLENIEPEISDQLSIPVQPFDIYGEYNGEFGDDEYKDWLWSEKLMYKNEKDIKLYTKNQIRLFINFFYAIHGYDFKNSLYRDYFQNINGYSYLKYKVNPKFSEKDFNKFERKNVDYLLQLEKMIP